MFIKKLLAILVFAAFTTQPMFAADASNTSTTGTPTPGTSTTTGTSATDPNATGTSATGASTPDATSTTAPASTSTTTGTSAAGSQDNDDDDDDNDDDNGQACNCPHKKNMMKIAEELQLTSAQKDQIKAIREKAKSSLQSSKEQMKSIRSQIHDLITSSSMDNSKLDSLVSQKTTILGNMIRVKIDAKHQMYMVLNPQQQQKFQQMMQDELKTNKCH